MNWNVSLDNHLQASFRPPAEGQPAAAPAAPNNPAPAQANAPANIGNYQPVAAGDQQPQQAATNPWGNAHPASNPWNDPQPAWNPWNDPYPAPNPWDGPRPVLGPWSYAQPYVPVYLAYPLSYPAPLLATPAAAHLPGQGNVQFFTVQPATEPVVVNINPPAAANTAQGAGNNAQAHHAAGGQGAAPQNPIKMVPQLSGPDQQLYCRELDGAYTLQTVNKIMQDLQPGYWKTSTSGFPYWVRTAKANA